MYCPHCKKEVAENDGVCENCGDILMPSEDEDVGKGIKNKYGVMGFLRDHIVGLILLGLIMTLAIGCVWSNMEPAILETKAASAAQLADSVHTAMLMAMMDEDLKKNPEFDSDLQALTTEFDLTTSKIGENCILDYAADVLGVDEFDQLKKHVKYPRATKRIMVTVTGENKVTVRIEGAVYDGREIMIQ
ncbi:MAG: zinc ribbon domain-containing protein [Lachnospiraceae bacterium]|nr:zinc ribbon domain-containing protein [Lachnospiraceae bacterium]